MSINQLPTKPLDWTQEYQLLLSSMDKEINTLESLNMRIKWAKYQTLIGIAGNFGLGAKELLGLRWNDVINKNHNDIFPYEYNKRKIHIYFNRSIVWLINKNHKIIDPVNDHHLILHKVNSPTTAISTRQFNSTLQKITSKLKIGGPNISSHTLRKTFAYHLWKDIYDRSTDGLSVVSKVLNHQDVKETQMYLSINNKQIRPTIIRF
ncbi:tyrosine-type recombinase/integrase [Marinoscillum sp.]|uniref:tyrosine-type recombinase/integrase n=1 Tax=Marinoscillum sp. TaxID=2024838 RepID=UPI003BA87318